MSIANNSVRVFEQQMAYYDGGAGDTLVFLHGNEFQTQAPPAA